MSKVSQQQRADCLIEWLKWMGKYFTLFLFFIFSGFLNAQIIGYRDSTFTTCHDTSIKVPIYGSQNISISGIYGNKVSSYLLTEAGQNAEIAWLKKEWF